MKFFLKQKKTKKASINSELSFYLVLNDIDQTKSNCLHTNIIIVNVYTVISTFFVEVAFYTDPK